MAGGAFITRRDGYWHYARRVPASVAHLKPGAAPIVKRTTKIRIADDPRGVKASKVAERINEEYEAYWRGLGEGQAAEAKRRFDAARKRARAFGFDYLQSAEIARAPVADLLDRVEFVQRNENEGTVAAILGTERPPDIMLDQVHAEYEALTAASRRDFSPDQIRKWRNPRLRAMANLIAVIGNKPIASISRDDAIEFQEWWAARLIAEDMDIGTANRDIGIVNTALNALDRRHRLGIGKVFADLRIAGHVEKSRLAMTPAFIQSKLLAPGALDVLNPEARDVVYLIAETGLRLSEAVNLLPERIVLDDAVPHVQVRPDRRRLKTPQSERDMPLVGVALAAMRRNPNGFPRYRDKAASFSAAVNKTLAANGLLEFERTIYSLRHTFEDRLTAVEAPEKLIANLMGHKHVRPKYGAGPGLAQKREWLQRIAFAVSAEMV